GRRREVFGNGTDMSSLGVEVGERMKLEEGVEEKVGVRFGRGVVRMDEMGEGLRGLYEEERR
uniref:hypothetical protein n=1 Tax=Bacillus altitudinis TaxID=293387 RepID=UPI003B5251C1